MNENEEESSMTVCSVSFTVRSASNEAALRKAKHLETYTKTDSWGVFTTRSVEIVLELEYKTLISNIQIMNKNSTIVDVAVAVENKRHGYLPVRSDIRLPHFRECNIKVGYLPCRYIRLRFDAAKNAHLEIYGIRTIGVPCHCVEIDAGSSMKDVLNDNAEGILFGSSLEASLPHQDCLSDTVSGTSAWKRENKEREKNRMEKLEKSIGMYPKHSPFIPAPPFFI